MATMNKFKKYLINFIVLYIIVSVLIWFCVKQINKKDTEEQKYVSQTVQEK